MKHQQVVPDYVVMLESSITILALVGCGWLLFKLVSACFYFPQYMKNLELQAEKANQHFEKTLMPKGSIVEEEAGPSSEKPEQSKEAEPENEPSKEETAKEEDKTDEGSQDSTEDDEEEATDSEKLPEEDVAEPKLDNESKKDK